MTKTKQKPQIPVRSTCLVGARPYYVGNWENSCDFCKHQEGRHYCLMREKQMKNMDCKRCDQWQERPNH